MPSASALKSLENQKMIGEKR